MSIIGWYYLHTNNELIYKPDSDGIVADFRESDFVKAFWPFDGSRESAWQILVEALSLEAKKERIFELAEKWKCTEGDALEFAARLMVTLGEDGNQKTATRFDFTNLAECPCGFGDTNLEALADLCSQLGFLGQKTWGKTFAGFCAD